MIRTLFTVAVLATLILAVGAACSGNNEVNISDVPSQQSVPTALLESPTAVIGTAVPGLSQVRTDEVIIRDGGLQPPQITITAGVPTELKITNDSSKDCDFSIGNIVQSVKVPAGQATAQTFTAPGVTTEDGSTGTSHTMTMGCDGDSTRQGSAIVEFKGVNPGTGNR